MITSEQCVVCSGMGGDPTNGYQGAAAFAAANYLHPKREGVYIPVPVLWDAGNYVFQDTSNVQDSGERCPNGHPVVVVINRG